MKKDSNETIKRSDLLHILDLAINVYTESLLRESHHGEPGDKLRNDDEYRGYIKALKWIKKEYTI